jgi:hypothetical protein
MRRILLFLVLLPSLFFLSGCSDDDSNNREPDKGEYSLRDIGPAGGFIFYVNPNYKIDGWRYLEVAPNDLNPKIWSSEKINILGTTETAIGRGMQNTLNIANRENSNNTAAVACLNYSIINNGITYDDWFLPSKDELELMFVNLCSKNVGNWPKSDLGDYLTYWSASEAGVSSAWSKCFQTKIVKGAPKDFPLSVRAIRAFQ